MELSEAVNRMRPNEKWDNDRYITLHSKLLIKQHDPHKTPELNSILFQDRIVFWKIIPPV